MSGEEAQLTLKDRLNFSYLLANQILTFQKATLGIEHSDREIIESIMGFIHIIPKNWKDKEFNDQVKEATIIQKVDVRPFVAGGIKLSEEACKKRGIQAFKEKPTFDFYKVFQACINLLDRKKMLSKIVRVEELVDIDDFAAKEIFKSNVSNGS